jgi:DNA mismatch endonuclease, patch repair protein
MGRIRSKNTSPEMAVRKMVHRMGFRYRLHVADLPGKPDLVFPRLRKIIEVKGCFWHQHDGCPYSRIPKSRTEYWAPKLLGNIERDRDNEQHLNSLGWQVLTIWECELKESTLSAKRIRRFLRRRAQLLTSVPRIVRR